MDNKSQLPQMLSMTDAMQRTGLSRRYIMDLITGGKIKYIQIHRKYLINAQSLGDYLCGESDKEGNK